MKTKPIIKNFLTRAAMTLAALLMTSASAWADTWDETTKTLTVTSDPELTYKDRTDIEHLVIGDGVNVIGPDYFSGCTGVKSVVISSRVAYIFDGAFKNCTSLTTVIDLAIRNRLHDIFFPPYSIKEVFNNASSSCHFYVHSQSMYDKNKDDYGDRITVISGITTIAGAIATTSAEPLITYNGVNYYTPGTQLTISHGDAAPNGYSGDFQGYQVSNSSGGDITSTALNGTTLTLPDDGDVTVKALYDLVEYTITYDLDGGEIEIGVGNIAYPTTYTIESREIRIDLVNMGNSFLPQKGGYDFLGWTGPGYDEPTKVIIIPSGSYGNRTYTANWQIKSYTISYNLDGGSWPEGVTILYSYTPETETFTLYNPTRKGYEFLGWRLQSENNSEAQIDRTIPKGSYGNKLFLAVWNYLLSDAIDLADNADNAALISEYEELSVDVTLQGRTLYRDGDWNTLTVPFSITDADDAAGISFTGTPLEGATVKTLSSSAFSNGTLTLNFEDATSIEAGKPYIVKWDGAVNLTINSTTDWNAFAESVNGGKLYAGKTVLLGADINVSTMVGTAEHPFSGTFEGAGHTLNVSISDGGDGAAPFRYISGATICNVKTTGSVSGGNYSAGLVGFASGGTNSIRDCYAAASVSGGSYASGILGNGATSTTTISSCMFDGYLSATNMGVFCGWGESGSTQTAENSVAYGTYADLSIIIDEGSGRSIDLLLGNGTKTVTNCFRNKSAFSQGDYWLIMHMGGDHPLRYDYLGSNWTYDNGQFALNPTVNLVDTNIKNPAFPNVMVDATASSVETTWVDFVGTYEPLSFSDADPSILFLGTESTLYYPLSGAYIGAQRAFFRLKGIEAGDTHNQARAFVLNFGDSETTGILSTTNLTNYTNSDAWYDLSGRRLNGKPTQKGLYINNGRKVVIK